MSASCVVDVLWASWRRGRRANDQRLTGDGKYISPHNTSAVIDARASTEDQGQGVSIPTPIEVGQAIAARCPENWQALAQHSQPYIGTGMRP
jgi:hypothetical protein